MRHSEIIDMPDMGGVNSDHDGRYIVQSSVGKLDYLGLLERSVDPADPSEGNAVIWMSDGTGSGDDGDIMIKITVGGTTSIGTLVDFSGL